MGQAASKLLECRDDANLESELNTLSRKKESLDPPEANRKKLAFSPRAKESKAKDSDTDETSISSCDITAAGSDLTRSETPRKTYQRDKKDERETRNRASAVRFLDEARDDIQQDVSSPASVQDRHNDSPSSSKNSFDEILEDNRFKNVPTDTYLALADSQSHPENDDTSHDDKIHPDFLSSIPAGSDPGDLLDDVKEEAARMTSLESNNTSYLYDDKILNQPGDTVFPLAANDSEVDSVDIASDETDPMNPANQDDTWVQSDSKLPTSSEMNDSRNLPYVENSARQEGISNDMEETSVGADKVGTEESIGEEEDLVNSDENKVNGCTEFCSQMKSFQECSSEAKMNGVGEGTEETEQIETTSKLTTHTNSLHDYFSDSDSFKLGTTTGTLGEIDLKDTVSRDSALTQPDELNIQYSKLAVQTIPSLEYSLDSNSFKMQGPICSKTQQQNSDYVVSFPPMVGDLQTVTSDLASTYSASSKIMNGEITSAKNDKMKPAKIEVSSSPTRVATNDAGGKKSIFRPASQSPKATSQRGAMSSSNSVTSIGSKQTVTSSSPAKVAARSPLSKQLPSPSKFSQPSIVSSPSSSSLTTTMSKANSGTSLSHPSRWSKEGRSQVCVEKWQPSLFSSSKECSRCFFLASDKDKNEYISTGSLRTIVRTRGGCGNSTCPYFHEINEPEGVRLCGKCFSSLHDNPQAEKRKEEKAKALPGTPRRSHLSKVGTN